MLWNQHSSCTLKASTNLAIICKPILHIHFSKPFWLIFLYLGKRKIQNFFDDIIYEFHFFLIENKLTFSVKEKNEFWWVKRPHTDFEVIWKMVIKLEMLDHSFILESCAGRDWRVYSSVECSDHHKKILCIWRVLHVCILNNRTDNNRWS